MTHVAHTLFFASLLALMQVVLIAMVVARRVQTGVRFLDGGDAKLMHSIRAHGNFCETVPLALLLLGLLELSGLGSNGLLAFGATLLVGRIVHAFSLLTNNATWSRCTGMVLTVGVISIEAVVGLWIVVR